MKVAVFNFKGGTGKSTTTLNLGAELARLKAKKITVTVVDLDGQRSLSYALGIEGKNPSVAEWLSGERENLPLSTTIPRLNAVPGSIDMYKLMATTDIFGNPLNFLESQADLVLMDCPPSLGIATAQAIANADRVLIPTLCEPAALKGLSEAIELIRADSTDKPIDVLRVRYKSRLKLTEASDDALIDASEDMNFKLTHTTIPDRVAIAESFAAQKIITDYDKKIKAFYSLAKELSKIWGLR